MKLIYLWIQKYNCFKEAEMNFCAYPRFHFDFSKMQITTVSTKDVLFPLDENLCIENISAIVGSNGSGKTSICSLVYNIRFNYYPDISYIMIYCINNKFYIDSSYHLTKIDFSKIPSNIIIEKESFAGSFNLLYYSPYYDPDHKQSRYVNGAGLFQDLSTSNLMEEDLQDYKNSRPDTEYKYDVDRVTAHEILDNIRVISFLAEYNNSKHEGFSLNMTFPQYIEFSADENQFFKFEAECHNHNSNLFNYYSLLKSNLDNNIGKNSIIEKILLAMFCNFATTYLLSDKIGFEKDIINEFLTRITKGIDSDKRNVVFALKSIFTELARTENLTNFKDMINNEKALSRLDFINFLLRLDDNLFINDSLQFNLSNKIEKKMIITFFNIYNYIKGTTNFIKTSYKPFISSGEKSELQLYSRLKYGLDKLIDEQKTKDTLLFFDEAEITLHPKLQQNLVNNLIHFLSIFYPEMKFQIILATHSPIILSDIPSSNVVFLNKDAGSVETIVKENTKQTFASNIYQLFNDSFFLDSTPIGDYARELIQYAIDDINKCYEKPEMSVSEKTKQIVGLIGEPVFRNILEDRIRK